jgi:DNA repair photolyase
MAGTYQGLRLNSQFFYCPNFLTFDSAQGCTHNCLYCFARNSYETNASSLKKQKRGILFSNSVNTTKLNTLRKVFTFAYDGRNSDSEAEQNLIEAIRLHMPLHIGGLSDPFFCEASAKITLQVLKLLKSYNHRFVLSTKSVKALDYYPEFLELFKDNVIQITLTGLNPKVNSIESGAGTTLERLKFIKTLSDAGIYVVVRLQPYMPFLFDDTQYSLDKFVRACKDVGAKAITLEFLKLCVFNNEFSRKRWKQFSEVIGFDIFDYFKNKSMPSSSDKELKPIYKIKHIEAFIEACKKYGVAYYLADNYFRGLGMGSTCCGYPDDLLGIKHKLYANQMPFIRGKDITFKDFYGESNKLFNLANCGFINTQSDPNNARRTWLGMAKEIWNNKDHPNNPANFFGGIKVVGIDTDNNLVYRYDETWVESLKKQKLLCDFEV